MLKDYLPFYKISGEMQWILRHMDLMGNDKLSEYNEDLPRYKKLLIAIQKACNEHGFGHTAKMAAHAAQREPKRCSDIHHELTSLNDSLTTELEREGIFRIDPANVDYYEKKDAFGPEVAKAFSKCGRDIQKAGSCYALEQEDACVHHLMLVLERGLYALAATVGVTFHRTNWQEIINNIAAKLNHMPKGREREFYTEVNSQFGFLKEAYRNHAEHARDDPYDMPKALHIYNHVRSFMQASAKGGLTE
jgi:hypothetical protein